MSDRWNICIPEKSRDGEKTYWTKVGTMLRRDKGGFVIHMAYPAAELFAFEPKPKDDQPRSQRQESARHAGPDEDPPRSSADEPAGGEYDDIPF